MARLEARLAVLPTAMAGASAMDANEAPEAPRADQPHLAAGEPAAANARMEPLADPDPVRRVAERARAVPCLSMLR